MKIFYAVKDNKFYAERENVVEIFDTYKDVLEVFKDETIEIVNLDGVKKQVCLNCEIETIYSELTECCCCNNEFYLCFDCRNLEVECPECELKTVVINCREDLCSYIEDTTEILEYEELKEFKKDIVEFSNKLKEKYD